MSAKDKITTWHSCSKCGVPPCSDTVDSHVCSDKGRLAKFAGGREGARCYPQTGNTPIPSWEFPDGTYFAKTLWNPLKPVHGDLVLRALVEKIGWCEIVCQLVFTQEDKLGKPDDFWPWVCSVALEIISKELGE